LNFIQIKKLKDTIHSLSQLLHSSRSLSCWETFGCTYNHQHPSGL